MHRLSADLLHQARQLARRERLRPKQASLRRAVSDAYYALFHFLIEEVTRLVIGASPRVTPLRHLAARAFVHGRMKSLCAEFLKNQPDHKLLAHVAVPFVMRPDAQLRIVARAFVDLQAFRHRADYDLSKVFNRSQALEAADQADAAMKSWRKVAAGNPDMALLFAVSMLLWPSLASH